MEIRHRARRATATLATLAALAILALASGAARAQVLRTDTLTLPMISFTGGFSVPLADMGRYTAFGQAGGAAAVKLKCNLYLALQGTVLFADRFKGPDPLAMLLNGDGYLMDQYGTPAQVATGMRGMHLQAKAGYIFSRLGHNPSSGLAVSAGVGLLQSKTWIQQRGDNVPQVMNGYEKGYDRLSNGLALTQFVGYIHIHDKNAWNFYAGIEATEAWTADRRSWDYALMRKNDARYTDIALTLRAGWIFCILKRGADDILYYH